MKNMSVYGGLAIESFRKLEMKKHQLALAEAEHHTRMASLPDEDMEEFIRVTEEMRMEITKNYEARVSKRQKKVYVPPS